jgi:SAM-dependent methyltransferase
MENLPFEDDVFDVVFAANSLQYTSDRIAALRELKRVCVPGGRVTVGLFGPPEKVAFRVIQEAVRGTLPNTSSSERRDELSTPGRLTELFVEVGLKIFESGEVDCPFTYPDFETFWRGMLSAGPFQSAIRTVGEGVLLPSIQEALEAFRIDDGSFYIAPNFFKYVTATV